MEIPLSYGYGTKYNSSFNKYLTKCKEMGCNCLSFFSDTCIIDGNNLNLNELRQNWTNKNIYYSIYLSKYLAPPVFSRYLTDELYMRSPLYKALPDLSGLSNLYGVLDLEQNESPISECLNLYFNPSKQIIPPGRMFSFRDYLESIPSPNRPHAKLLLMPSSNVKLTMGSWEGVRHTYERLDNGNKVDLVLNTHRLYVSGMSDFDSSTDIAKLFDTVDAIAKVKAIEISDTNCVERYYFEEELGKGMIWGNKSNDEWYQSKRTESLRSLLKISSDRGIDIVFNAQAGGKINIPIITPFIRF